MKYTLGNNSYDSEYLEHFGIKGMSWGRRRFQDENGLLTAAGKARYGIENAARSAGNAIGGAARSAGNAIGGAARSAGNAISRGAQSARAAVSSGARAVDRTMGFSAPSRLNQARSQLSSVQRRQEYIDQKQDTRYWNSDAKYKQQVSDNKRLESRAQGHDLQAQSARNEAMAYKKSALSSSPNTSLRTAMTTSQFNSGVKAAQSYLTASQNANYHSEAAKAYRLLALQNNSQAADYYNNYDVERTAENALHVKERQLRNEIERLEREVDDSILNKVKKTFGKGKSWVTGLFGR